MTFAFGFVQWFALLTEVITIMMALTTVIEAYESSGIRVLTISQFSEVAKGDLGEKRILLGKIAEGGRFEPLNSCYIRFQLRAK